MSTIADPLVTTFKLEILDFQPIGAIDALRYQLEHIPGGDKRVSLAHLLPGQPKIVIKGEPVTRSTPITFRFQTFLSEQHPYMLMGVAFARKDRTRRQYTDYQKNFPAIRMELAAALETPEAKNQGIIAYSQLTVDDYCLFEKDEELKSAYTFALYVQKVPTGTIGIIDPDLEHDFEPSTGT